MYEMTRQIFCSDIGGDGEVRNSAVVDMLQDASNFHLETHPVMSPFFESSGCVMFLVSRQIDIGRRPAYGEKIRVRTWTYELNRMYGFRNTVVYGEDGEPCIKAIAGGAFMDTSTQKPIRVPAELIERVGVYPKMDMEYCSRKIALPETEPEIYEPVVIRRCDIDMNLHVNNARYVDITDEYLPEGAKAKRIRIEYKTPLKRGNKAVPYVYTSGNMVTVSLNDEKGKSYCVVEYTLVD